MKTTSVMVVGAGAWGGWTAYMLQKAGFQVTLIDKSTPGNTHSGSGGPSRVIRLAYGGDRLYTDLTERAFQLWRKAEQEWNESFYHETGALWMFQGVDPAYARLSQPLMAERGYELAPLPLEKAQQKFPQIDFTGITSTWFEPTAGYLEANRSCQVVCERFQELGGHFLQEQVVAVNGETEIESISLSSGEQLSADQYVFACGPWMGQLFPLLKEIVHVSRQEVYYFHSPETLTREFLPIWIEFRQGTMFYGIPGNKAEGFKVAYDQRSWPLDPENDNRELTPEIFQYVSQKVIERFPGIEGQSLLRHHTCVYESSPDGDFIIDQLPGCSNAYLLCGSSGHGFKMGPAIGERIAHHISNQQPLPLEFSLDRLKTGRVSKTQYDVV